MSFIFRRNIASGCIYSIYNFFPVDRDKRLGLLFFKSLLKQSHAGNHISSSIGNHAGCNTSS